MMTIGFSLLTERSKKVAVRCVGKKKAMKRGGKLAGIWIKLLMEKEIRYEQEDQTKRSNRRAAV